MERAFVATAKDEKATGDANRSLAWLASTGVTLSMSRDANWKNCGAFLETRRWIRTD
jgi:hypothetical protein